MELIQGVETTYVFSPDLEAEVLTEAEFAAIEAEKSYLQNSKVEC